MISRRMPLVNRPVTRRSCLRADRWPGTGLESLVIDQVVIGEESHSCEQVLAD